MVPSSSRPELTPQFCFSTTALRDFLRLSRGVIDDSITQNLNGLVEPARKGFDPSASVRLGRPAGRQLIDKASCDKFKAQSLFPSWQTRSDVLNYCASVATSPDPEDPDSVLRAVESAKDRERIVDERLDPYSARFFPREARTELLANTVRTERSVENIVRERTWNVVTDRCGNIGQKWEDELNRWRERNNKNRS